ncbi:MAG: hypothetical protein ABIA77_02810 [Candidatus Omnitrophota bacterium]
MFRQKKHVIVVTFSSVIIAIVLISTLIGYSLYVRWKEDSFGLKYRNSIYKLTAELFRKDIVLANVNVVIGEDDPFAGMPVIGGSLKNNSSKTLTSILVEISFYGADGAVIFKDRVYPLGGGTEKQYPGPDILSANIGPTRNILLPGEGISFRHLLRNCPRKLIAHFDTKSKFARVYPQDKITMKYSVEGLNIL